MPSKQSCCCGGDKVVMTVACSGRSNTGQLTNDAAKLIDRTGTARFVCLAAIGAEDPEVTDLAKCAGRLLVLEFSRVRKELAPLYDRYSFDVLPWLGARVAGDEASYRYLAESIRMHPDQETLKKMMEDAGFSRVRYYNLTAGVVALHEGTRL